MYRYNTGTEDVITNCTSKFVAANSAILVFKNISHSSTELFS